MENNNNQNHNKYIVTEVIKNQFKNKIFVGVFIGIIIFCLMVVFYNNELFDDFELNTLCWRFKYFNNSSHPSDKFVIVGLNRKSIQKYGDLPWNREIYAELLEALDFYGVKSVTFDIFFTLKNKVEPQGDVIFVNEVQKFQKNKRLLTVATRTEVIPKSIKYYDSEEKDLIKSFSIKTKKNFKAPEADQLYSLSKDDKKDNHVIIQKSYDALFKVLSSMGLAETYAKKGLNIISIPLFYKYKLDNSHIYFPALSLATYLNVNKNPEVNQRKGYLIINGKKIPTIEDNEFLINWYKPFAEGEMAYRRMEIDEIIDSFRFLKWASKKTGLSKEETQDKIEQLFVCHANESCSKELIAFEKQFPPTARVTQRENYKDKYIFVGLLDQTAGSQDLIKTPLLNEMPGVFMHANIVDNLLQDDFIKKASNNVTILIMLVLCICTGVTVLGIKNPIYSLGIGILYLFYFIIPLLLFNYFHIWSDLFYTETAIILTFGLCIGYQSWVVDKDKRFLKRTFSNYLSPQILTEVLSDPSKVRLGGKRKEISILFSDIRGFTTISEQSEPEEIVKFLNEYFDEMVDQVMKTEGTLDKFIGDAVMAFWGAPMEYDNHAEKAVKGALGMVEALNKLKKKWKAEGKEYPEINIGIGINTGPALVGNVGSSKLKNYTIIGDSVNLASRLEGLNKKYATHEENELNIIISEYTFEHVKDIFNVKYLGEETVKGKDIPVKIYKVTGIKGGK